ncbi:MAG: PD40 domain-containing protein [Deltaproteobacteria bacterium]|nr:PD40 domain-containing protein [Deltaproteobacteria bacterium]MDQ3295656.1 hypothetical protein [Myxococcota bacterium]
MRPALLLLALAACYSPTPEGVCTVACTTACPGELVCGGDGLCRATDDLDCVLRAEAGVDVGSPDAPRVQFGLVTRVDAISSGDTDDDPTVSPNGLEMYFNSVRTGSASGDIYRSTRPAPGQLWSTPLLVSALNSAAYENTPRLSFDGLVMHIGVADEILMSTRQLVSSTAWTTPMPVGALSSMEPDAEASMTRDQLSIYFASNRSGNYDIYVATRESPGSDWGPVTAVPGLNSAFDDESPFTTDGLTMYFSSRRTHTLASSNLWMATRPTVTDAFGPAVPLDELNTDGAEEDPWLSEDGSTIWFASSRLTSFDIFTATR